jgi:predicted RNA methylase
MLIFFIILLLLILYLLFFWVIPFSLKGAIFDPSKKRDVEKMIAVAEIKGEEISADLGSGDGRIVIAFAKKGIQAHGFEINPFLVLISRRNIRRAGLKGKAFIHWKNFWKADLSKFDIITVFQVDFAMNELENKLKKELKSGAKVISNQWTFPKWKYSKYENGIYVYDSSELPTK